MVRLLMEAFMIISIVTGMVFMMRVSAAEKESSDEKSQRLSERKG